MTINLNFLFQEKNLNVRMLAVKFCQCLLINTQPITHCQIVAKLVKQVILTIGLLVLLKQSCCFESQLLGNLSDSEYKKSELCSTKLCVRDADRLLYDASDNSSKIDPCNDFRK